MKKSITMPQLGDSMKQGVLAAWNYLPGDPVKRGAVLFEVETDKVVSEVECLQDGILTEILYEEGDRVPVGAVIGYLEEA